MNHPLPRLIAALAVLAIALGLRPAASAEESIAGEDKSLTVLFSTDLYGNYRQVNCGRSGADVDFANLVSAIDKVRQRLAAANLPPPLLLNGGDNIGPYVFSRFLLSQGTGGAQKLTRWLVRAGYEIVALGNQDFFAPPQSLKDFLQEGQKAGLIFSAANLDCRAPQTDLCSRLGTGSRGYHLVERDGLKIALVSLIHGDLAQDAPPEHLVGITVLDPYKKAREVIRAARADGADLVILLSHLEHTETSPQHTLELVHEVPDVDLVIANSFTPMQVKRGINILTFSDGATPVVGCDLNGQHLGQARLRLVRLNQRWKISSVEASEVPVAPSEPDSMIRQELLAVERSYCDQWDRPLGEGKLEKPMDAAGFTRYLLELMRTQTHRELAFVNRGVVAARSVFPITGAITRHDLFAALPFPNRLYLFSLDGPQLTKLCAAIIGEEDQNGQSRLIPLGIECRGGIKINGRPLDPEGIYQAVTIEYLAKGMLGYFKDRLSNTKVFWPKGRASAPLLSELGQEFFSKEPFIGPSAAAIDLENNFVSLDRKLRWGFWGAASLNLSNIHIDNGPSYQESQLNRDLFTSLKGELRGRVGASSIRHKLWLDLWLKYAESSSKGLAFIESEDLTTANMLYQYNAFGAKSSDWYVPWLYGEGKLETELTKPEQGRDFHHFEVTATTGVRFSLLPTLETKVGIGGRREIFDPNARVHYGLDLGYELVRTDLMTLFKSPLQLESSLGAFFGDIGRNNSFKGRWTNRVYFALIGHFFFNITHELFLYRESTKGYGVTSDLTFGVTYQVRHSIQSF